MIAKVYEITMDVSLTSNLLDSAKVVEELESKMQMKMGPELADCPNNGSRRRLRLLADEIPNEISSRELFLDKHIVGNALFDLKHDLTASCTATEAPTAFPCIVVDATMTLYLKEDQNVLSVINRISSLFQENSLNRILGLSSDPFAAITVTDLEEGVFVSPTLAPTVSLMYAPNTPEECAAIISRKEPLSVPAGLIGMTFDIYFEVSLTLQLSDISEVVKEMKSRMQRILGPVLADCEENISGEYPTTNVERHVIADLWFDLAHEEYQTCDYDSPTPCIRVSARLTLALKGQEYTLPLANRIIGVFGEAPTETLGLTAPFKRIEVVGVTGDILTLSPTSSPTAISSYGPLPCSSISNKESVPNQDTMIGKTFDVLFEVSLTLQLSDLSEVFDEMERRLQRYIAPKLAGCSRRRLSEDNDRKLASLERGVVGNAQFFLVHQPDQNCDADAPTPCHRVVGKLNVYLNEDQESLVLANHITDILFNEELTTATQLTAPFNQIEVVGVLASEFPFVPDDLTLAPTPIGDPNSREACAAIASGLPVPDQDLMIPYDFDLNMRVFLTLQLSDMSEVVNELEARMQRILAPLLADCPQVRRLGQSDVGATRELVDDIAIGNAQFQLFYLESVSCDTSITSPCIRVNARLRLFLKSEERYFRIITEIFETIADTKLVDVLDLTAPFAAIELLTVNSVDPTMEPTGPPTPLPMYDANSPDECEAISLGGPLPGQDAMMSMTFDIRMDVSLTLQLSDLSEVVEEMESRMQRILGPVLADCEENTTNGSIERHVIANALFDAAYQEEETCDFNAPAPCIRVLTKLTVVLKGPKDSLPLANHITGVLGSAPLTEMLGFTAPFNTIEVVGLTLGAPNNPPANSEGCAAIATGLPVPDQDLMIPYDFDLNMRVLLTLQLSDMSEVVNELEARMQRILAPLLADCPEGRRLGETDFGAMRELVDNDIAIGNAQFQLFYLESVSCDTSITSPCIRVDARLRLFLKSEERYFRIIVAIMEKISNTKLVDVLGLTAPFAEIEIEAVKAIIATMEPTGSPSPLPMYDANSPEECEAISLGEPVPGQDAMMIMSFDIRMDVSLTLQLSDLSEVVEEMESRMQRILGPVLADCEENTTDGPIERHVIANALFDAAYQEDETCDGSAPSPCIRVLTKFTVVLKGEEGVLPLANHITGVLGSAPLTEMLGFTAPFNTIEVVGVTVAAP